MAEKIPFYEIETHYWRTMADVPQIQVKYGIMDDPTTGEFITPMVFMERQHQRIMDLEEFIEEYINADIP
jgi:hypothetical protein